MTAESLQTWQADQDDYLNFSKVNEYRSSQDKQAGEFSLKVPKNLWGLATKVSQFRLPIKKGEKWSAKVWAKRGNLNESHKSSPPTPEGGVSTLLRKVPPSGVRGLFGGLTLVTPLIVPNLGIPQGDRQALNLNLFAAIPLVKKLLKSPPTPEGGVITSKTPPSGAGGLFIESTQTAYLLVELLDEKNNIISAEHKKVYVTSQGQWQQLAIPEEVVNLGEDCRQGGFLRLNLVNDSDNTVYFDYFEITHRSGDEKLSVTSWTDYYPFGKVAKTSCSGAGAYRYGYQGEFAEKDSETDWNSFDLRPYDSDVARWLSVDPYQQYWSPYVAMGNDPSNRIDPDGGVDEYAVDSQGNRTWLSDMGRDEGLDFFHVGDWASATSFVSTHTVVAPMAGAMGWLNDGFRQQIADFSRNNVSISLGAAYERPPLATGAITPSYPEGFLIPLPPIFKAFKNYKIGLDAAAKRGLERAAKFGAEWGNASLKQTIQKFAPNSQGLVVGNKILYQNHKTSIQVVYDKAGNYFRIEKTTLTGKRRYLDIEGHLPNNKIIDGRVSGRNQAEYNQITHFNNID